METHRSDENLVKLAQFLSLFKNVLKLQSLDKNKFKESDTTIGVVDLEYALMKPQFSPLCGEIVTKLMSKNISKVTANQKEASEESEPTYRTVERSFENFEQESASTIQYEAWNL